MSTMPTSAAGEQLWRDADRRRLVRLCAAVSGDRAAAEDLAQETLLEAWRNRHKLRDPAGADRWLAAIARNVCRRWARERGREPRLLEPVEAESAAGADELDLELELEHEELVELLDRALAALPAATRDVLVARFVHELPHAEIGARLGLSEDAVSMRISRGKVVLRRLLGSELRDEAAVYGLAGDTWRDTRVWCSQCGAARLLARLEPDATSFRCPRCEPGQSIGSSFSLENPFFVRLVGDLVRPTAILGRAAEWTRRYFAPGATGSVDCTRCGGSVRLRRYERDASGARSEGLFAECEACGEVVSSSVGGLALAEPEVQQLRRSHPRLRALPPRPVESEGKPAIVIRYEALLGSAAVDVVFARDSLRLLRVA